MSNTGSSKLKELCEEVFAGNLQLKKEVYEIGAMATEAMLHDAADDGKHPVVIKAFRDALELLQHPDAVCAHIERAQLTQLHSQLGAILQTGYQAAVEGTTIDYAKLDGEEIQKAVVPLLERCHQRHEQLLKLRAKIDEATK